MGSSFARICTSIATFSALLVSTGCGDLPAPATCATSDSCPSGAWCRSGSCVANAAPVAVIDPPASAGTNRPLVFRGTGSHDPDEGDSISGWSWKVVPLAGPGSCDPLPGTGTGVDFSVVFPCAGDHEVTLTVVDSMGLASAPLTLRVRVEPTIDPPAVAAGPTVSIEHRCGGTPLTCTPWDGDAPDFLLSATGSGPAGVTMTYRWSVELPAELAQQPPPRITFFPGETAAQPMVRIETAGTAIAGAYTFVVAATDSRGMVAVGRQRVEVGNRPPVLSGGGPVLLPHGYDASTRRFVATGETGIATWSDPDGDPVTALGFTSTRSGDGGNVFDVQGLVDRARITVVVPFSVPSDAALLIGPGVARRVELVVADANGARASTAWDVEVTNRVPRLVAAVASASVDHTYEASFQRYAAQAALSTWVDDDGDPLLPSLTGDPTCGEVVERQGTAWVTCSSPFTGRPDPGRLIGPHALTASMADPFASGAAQQAVLEIRNRAPRLLGSVVVVTMPCLAHRDVCCFESPDKGTCVEHDFQFVETSLTTPVVADDDGDPLDLATVASGGCLTAGTTPPACLGAACAPALKLCGDPSLCGAWTPGGTLSVVTGDGVDRVTGSISVDGVCPP